MLSGIQWNIFKWHKSKCAMAHTNLLDYPRFGQLIKKVFTIKLFYRPFLPCGCAQRQQQQHQSRISYHLVRLVEIEQKKKSYLNDFNGFPIDVRFKTSQNIRIFSKFGSLDVVRLNRARILTHIELKTKTTAFIESSNKRFWNN